MATKDKNTLYLPLQGMDSEHCAMIIDKGLKEVKGISSHKVELNNNRAVIETNDAAAVLPVAVKQVRSLGYDVPTVKKTYPVLNMSCASCAASSQDVLTMQPGVVSATVNYANGNGTIEFIPTITNPQVLKSALQSVGYDLMIDESDEATDSLTDLQREHYNSLKKRTLWSVALSVPLVVLGMVPVFMKQPWVPYLMWVLATPVVLYFGRQFFIGAYKQAKHRSANMDTLVALSTGVAYLFSVFNTLFPEFWHKQGRHADVYFEASAVVIAFILLGKLLEDRAKAKTSSAIKGLMGLQPKTVTVVHHGGHQMEMPVSSVQQGTMLLVKPGEKIAVDGTVTTGSSYVDESMISGEPVAVIKQEGSKVFAGTLNQKGSFQFRADKVGSDTLLAQIIKMVQDAQGSRAPVQNLVDKIAGIFVPVVIAVAVLTFVAWIVLGGQNGFTQGLMAMVTVLVIACPCALGLATPTAIMVGVGRGASLGILIKDADSLEHAAKVTAVVLDKTGTLTQGKPQVTDVKWFVENDECKSLFFSIEKSSSHPLAEAITAYFGSAHFIEGITIENNAGKGVRAEFNGKTYWVGNRTLLTENNITIGSEAESWVTAQLEKAQTLVFFADESQLLAAVAIADALKPTSVAAVKQLQAEGIAVYMLTGDNEATAKTIAETVGIQQYKANVLPQDKLDFVKELQQKGNVVAMAGDGINDSAALAQADVSIAMGRGSDVAMDVAKMTIISGDLLKLPIAIHLSRKTMATVRQNLFWAFIYNVIGIPVAAGLLYPVNGFLLNPMIAGAAMALSSVSVVSNSLLLKIKKI
ncbi:heavy metal translocating P-type ATPase [Flavobacterium sp. RHBU_3]|uniref:heavy metal translocating P-type ATPase n=1 Tax=Flavobacterium sp. RHBU_3 TaxID=3391184 RepID=UPI00398481C1